MYWYLFYQVCICFRLCTHQRHWWFRRLLLPMPRFPLRRFWQNSQRTSSLELGGSPLRVYGWWHGYCWLDYLLLLELLGYLLPCWSWPICFKLFQTPGNLKDPLWKRCVSVTISPNETKLSKRYHQIIRSKGKIHPAT